MKPRLWKMYGVWWCGDYIISTYDGCRVCVKGSVCRYYMADAYQAWKDKV